MIQEEFACTQMVEALETRTLLSANPELVADLMAGALGSNPSQFVNVNGTLFFSADDGVNGIELWKSDGTASGTSLVKDIRTGSNSSHPRFLTNVNGTLFFSAYNDTNGGELWKSDGTAAGTKIVKDLVTGGSSFPSSLTNVNGTLYFFAFDRTNGYALWQTDGSETATTLVKDFAGGTSGPYPSSTANVNGTLFFRAAGGSNGFELWKSDGTDAGTLLVKDINRFDSSYPTYLTNVNGKLYFTATDGTNGYELWQSDGTEAGTMLVEDLVNGTGGSYPRYLTNVNGTLFFAAHDGSNSGLWQSDGTSAGTSLVKDLFTNAGGRQLMPFTNVNGTLFFSASDSTNRLELWQSDGTIAGTKLVKDIYRGSGGSSPGFLTNMNGTLFFRSTDGTSGYELWKVEIPANTPKVSVDATNFLPPAIVKDIVVGGNGSGPLELTNVNGMLIFTAYYGTNGSELLQSNGTAVGTTLVKGIRRTANSRRSYLTNVNGSLFFRSFDLVNGYELWKSNGTASETALAADVRTAGISNLRYLTNVNGTLFFSAGHSVNGDELWKSDGTSAGTRLVKDINTGSENSRPHSLTNVNGTLYFSAFDNVNGYELWRSDGTSVGTSLVKDIFPGTTGSNPLSLTNVNGTLFFGANDGTNGYELWQSDGTSAGTTLVKNINAGSSDSNPVSLANVNGTLFFRSNDGTNGYELWRSDGTTGGTSLVKDIAGGNRDSSPWFLTNVNGALFFTANDGTNGYGLWQSDGTSAGTKLVQEFQTSGASSPLLLTNVNGTMFFRGYSPTHGTELWSMPVNSRPRLTTFTSAVDSTAEDTEVELTFAELLAQSDATDADGTVDAFIVQAVSSGTLKIGTNPGSATAFAVGSNDRIDATFHAYWTPDANAIGNTIAAFTLLAQDNIGVDSIRPITAAAAVTAVADSPLVTNAATFANVQTTSGLVISRNDVDGAEVTHFKITNIIGGSLFQHDGTTQINDGDFVTFAQANSGLKFTPASNSTATGHLTVQASTSNLDTGLGGSTVTASIAVTIPVPTMTGPTAVTMAQRPTISWNGVSGADRYVLFIANLSSSGSSFQVRTVTGTSYTPTADFGIGAYEVRVRAISASGDSSAYSQKLSFRITTSPVFSNVVSFQATTTPTLTWNSLTGAVTFDLWLNNLSTGQQQIVRDMNVTGTSWTSPTSLPMGKYRAWIRGTDMSGLQANWSMAANFYVLPPVSVVSPVAPTFDRTPTFTWNPVPGAVSYDLYYQNHTTGSVATSIMNISGNTFTPSSNLAEGNHQWYVIAVMQGNYRSQSAIRQYFFVGGRPTVLTPTGSTFDTTPTFTWTPVTGAVRYKLLVSRTDVPTNGVISQTSLTMTSFTPTTALSKGTYRAWVLAISSTGSFSLWSDPVNFTVASSDHESSVLPGALLLSHVRVLDDVPSEIIAWASSDSEDVAVVSREAYVAAQETAQLRSEIGKDRLARVAAISQSERGRSRFSSLELSIARDEAGVDALMADVTSMMQVFEI